MLPGVAMLHQLITKSSEITAIRDCAIEDSMWDAAAGNHDKVYLQVMVI